MSGVPYSEDEVALLRRHYPDVDLLVSLMKGRSRVAIMNKASTLGLTKPLPAFWTMAEDNIVRRLHPNLAAIKLALPNRTTSAIKTRIVELKVSKRGRAWTPERNMMLLQLAAKFNDDQIAKCLGSTGRAVGMQRRRLGMRREVPAPHLKVRLAFVKDIRDHAKRTGVRLQRLMGNLNSGRLSPSTPQTKISWPKVVAAVQNLGGELYAEWPESDR